MITGIVLLFLCVVDGAVTSHAGTVEFYPVDIKGDPTTGDTAWTGFRYGTLMIEPQAEETKIVLVSTVSPADPVTDAERYRHSIIKRFVDLGIPLVACQSELVNHLEPFTLSPVPYSGPADSTTIFVYEFRDPARRTAPQLLPELKDVGVVARRVVASTLMTWNQFLFK